MNQLENFEEKIKGLLADFVAGNIGKEQITNAFIAESNAISDLFTALMFRKTIFFKTQIKMLNDENDINKTKKGIFEEIDLIKLAFDEMKREVGRS